MKIELAKTEIIHFVGIGGIGMSGLALIMKGMGFKIQGSDISLNKNIERLKKNKIKIIVGHRKKNINKATQSMIEGLRGSLMIMGSMGLVFIFFPHIIVPLFTSDQEVISLGKQILPWVGLIQFVDAFAITLWFALSGAGDTKFTGYLGIVASWGVFVPLSYILGIKLNFGLSGPWIAFAVFLIIEASLVIFRVLQGKWKHIEV